MAVLWAGWKVGMLAKWLERRSADQLAVLMAGRMAELKAETSENSLGKKWVDWKVQLTAGSMG
jgi:hypothetical protein